MNQQHPIVLIDGHCNLCHRAARFIIQRDRAARFRFASIQSDVAAPWRPPEQSSNTEPETVILIENDHRYERSTAALRIVRHLDGLWPLLYIFIILPRPIRDGIYRWIARNRYRWFGRKDQCLVPTEELKQRFL